MQNWHNLDIQIKTKQPAFNSGTRAGITHLGLLFDEVSLFPYETLKQKYDISGDSLLQYSQLKHCLKGHAEKKPFNKPLLKTDSSLP